MAGFYVVGVDIKPQPHYCGDEFYQADALTFPLEGYDTYHASPPCQGYSVCTKLDQRSNYRKLINPIRNRLVTMGLPYVIENVMGAKKTLKANLMLCGTMFGLPIHRHRLFEIYPDVMILSSPCHKRADVIYITGSRRDSNGDYAREPSGQERKDIMSMPWATINEIDEAIPPAYTEFIGKYLIQVTGEGVADHETEQEG